MAVRSAPLQVSCPNDHTTDVMIITGADFQNEVPDLPRAIDAARARGGSPEDRDNEGYEGRSNHPTARRSDPICRPASPFQGTRRKMLAVNLTQKFQSSVAVLPGDLA